MGKGLHKVFKTVVKEILQDLPPMGESGSEVPHFIPEPRDCSDVTKLSDDIKKPWMKATQKYIENIINKQNFIVQEPKKGEPVTQSMDVYKDKIQSDWSLDQLKLSIVVRGYLQHKEIVGYTWSPTTSMTLKYFLAYSAKYKARFYY